jgi:hypothetical protein
MNKLLVAFLFLTTFAKAQTLIAYDYIETMSWGTGGAGWTVGCGACGYYSNVSVSPTLSAALIGSGNGSSPIESGTYILSNITGLTLTSSYTLTFRAGAYRLGAPSATTAGNDAADYFDVQYSTNGGVSYTTEMRITGFSNASWNYNLNATASKIANGTQTTFTPAAGGNRTTTGDGYSIIELMIPIGVTQLAFRIPTRSNSAGEEWWFDNFELWETPQTGMPVDMVSFEGLNTEHGNLLIWKTASEHNSSHYLIERSTTGEFNENTVIETKQSAGNSTELLTYTFVDTDYRSVINYYRITQVDFDGQFKIYGPISINNSYKIKKIIKIINGTGQEVDEHATGILFEIYEDGTIKKVIR